MAKVLENFNGSCYFVSDIWFSNEELDLFTDSAGSKNLGCGVYFANKWAYFPWPESWQSEEIMRDITFLELVPIVLAIHLFKLELSCRKFRFHTDNKALVAIINKKSSKSKRVMQLIRPLVILTMLNNMQVMASHIEGSANGIADSISRQEWDRFRMLAPNAELKQRDIPKDFMNLILGLRLTDL